MCDGFHKAVNAFGSQSAMAEALHVTKGRVSQWGSKGRVPMERCFQIEKHTRAMAAERRDARLVVVCEDLRPDLDWSVVRSNPLPGIASDAHAGQ